MTSDLGVRSGDGAQMLERARRLFGGFVGLALVVFALEWIDATTPLWPQRAIAVPAILGTGLWALTLVRWHRQGWFSDLAIVGLLIVAGWGMGRPGTILVGILAVLQLRAMYGTRWTVALTSGGVLGAYVVVEGLQRGLGRALSVGSLTVVVAGAAVVVIVRSLGEVLARRDIEAAWNAVLTDAGVQLVAATTTEEVAEIERTARHEMAALTLRGVDASAERAAAQRRLENDVALATERIRSQMQYRILAEHSRDGIYLAELGPPLRYRYLNPAGAAMVGLCAEELLADPRVGHRVVHPDDRAVLTGHRERSGVLPGRVEVRVLGSSGQQRWVAIEERELEAEGGTRLVLGTLRDVTEERRREQALRSALEHERLAAEELRAVDEMKSTFLRALSHELRTPLAAVVGATETLRSRWQDLTPAQIATMTEIAERRARHLGRLLEDLLDVDRLSGGAVEPRRAPTRVLALVQRVATETETGTHPVTVVGEEVEVALDRSSVERIVDNLLGNARKHTPAGTAVRCAVAPTAAGVRLTVEDDGPGIEVGAGVDVFAPFVQGAASAARSQPGTGIGLSLVSKLAELHGGGVRLESPATGGTRFVVDLPGPHSAAPFADTGLSAQRRPARA